MTRGPLHCKRFLNYHFTILKWNCVLKGNSSERGVKDVECKLLLMVCRGWPFSCPATTVLLSRSFSFQSAFSNFSIVGMTVKRTQKVLSRAAQLGTQRHQRTLSANKIHQRLNYIVRLSSAPLMALIEEDVWGVAGQRLFVRLGEVWSVWVDQYLDREQSKVKFLEKTWEKKYYRGE